MSSAQRSYRRVAILQVEETYEQIEGEWIRLPHQTTIDQVINDFLTEKGVYPVSVSNPTIQQFTTDDPNLRKVRIGVSVIYVPNEVISDEQSPSEQEKPKGLPSDIRSLLEEASRQGAATRAGDIRQLPRNVAGQSTSPSRERKARPSLPRIRNKRRDR